MKIANKLTDNLPITTQVANDQSIGSVNYSRDNSATGVEQ